jgi:hypothetical protein
LISLFFGGWIAGQLSASTDRNAGAMHGFLGWCTVTVFSVVLLTMAGGSALGGSLGVVGSSMAANDRSSDAIDRDSGMISSDLSNPDHHVSTVSEAERNRPRRPSPALPRGR